MVECSHILGMGEGGVRLYHITFETNAGTRPKKYTKLQHALKFGMAIRIYDVYMENVNKRRRNRRKPPLLPIFFPLFAILPIHLEII